MFYFNGFQVRTQKLGFFKCPVFLHRLFGEVAKDLYIKSIHLKEEDQVVKIRPLGYQNPIMKKGCLLFLDV